MCGWFGVKFVVGVRLKELWVDGSVWYVFVVGVWIRVDVDGYCVGVVLLVAFVMVE